MRAFVALPVSAEVRTRLHEVMLELGRAWPCHAIRWTPPEHIHLTLRFLGEVPESAVGVITAGLRDACDRMGPLSLSVEGVGAFPCVSRPRVIWGGVGSADRRLAELQRRVAAAMAAFGQPEARGFHAHLTLGRVKPLPPRELRAASAALENFHAGGLGAWTADRVQLVRSELSPGGPHYAELAAIPLTAG